MTEQFTFFWNGPFSQWYSSDFVIHSFVFLNSTPYGLEFNCAEQYMMYQKAMLFGDNDTGGKILETDDPRKQKSLGRTVSNFNPDQWNAVARDIVFRGSMAKFTQNANLKEILLQTKGTTLVEASPYDKIWGIGLKENDPKALNRETWQGENWLGEVLTEVRDSLL